METNAQTGFASTFSLERTLESVRLTCHKARPKGMRENIRRHIMNAYALQEKSFDSRIFSFDCGIIARENASDDPDMLDWDYAQNLGTLFNPNEVTEILNVSRSTVYKMIERGFGLAPFCSCPSDRREARPPRPIFTSGRMPDW